MQKISDSDIVPLKYYNNIIVPIMDSISSGTSNSNDGFIQSLNDRMLQEEMYEETQMVNFYEKTAQFASLFHIIGRINSPIFLKARNLPGFTAFLKANDPRI